MIQLILSFIKDCFLYQPRMTESEVYEFFLKDSKKENPHKITTDFYKDLTGVRKDIIEYDKKYYRVKGNNNLVRLTHKYSKETENTLQYIKKGLKRQLYELYLININIGGTS